MAKQKKKRRTGGKRRKRAAVSVERVPHPVNPMQKQLEALNALRPVFERARAERERRAGSAVDENG